VFHLRSRRCVKTNITWRPFRRRISILYLSNMRYQLLFTLMYSCKQTNKQHRTDLLLITGPLESPIPCSYMQQDIYWVECANWLSFILLWLVAYYIFLRTFHFSLSSSSPFPQQQVMAPPTHQLCAIESKSSRMMGTSSNAPLGETQQHRRHQLVHRDAAIAATNNMTQDAHWKNLCKTRRSNNRQQHAIGSE